MGLKSVVVLYNGTDLVDSVFPLVLKKVGESDEGNYTCVLEMLLRYFKPYNVSENTSIKVKGMQK